MCAGFFKNKLPNDRGGNRQSHTHMDIATYIPDLKQTSQPISQTDLEAELVKTSLLRRLQAQTLPNATPPIGKIPPFSKICPKFSTTDAILMPFGIYKVLDHYDIVYFIAQRASSLGVVWHGAAKKLWEEKAHSLTHSINES